MIFIPFALSGSVKLILSVTIPALIFLGYLSYNWKRSTLNINEQISGTNRMVYYSSLLLTLFVIGNIFSFIMLGLDIGFGELGWQLKDWGFLNGERLNGINYGKVNWFNVFYSYQINILLIFSIYFFMNRFFKNIKNYFIFFLILVFLGVIFGGTMNTYFSGFSTIDGTQNSTGQLVYARYYTVTFPDAMFIPSLIYPFFGISEFYQLSVSTMLSNYSRESAPWPFLVMFNKDMWQWSMVIIIPYIHIGTYIFFGIMTSYIKK
ncbi:MAG: hypothetical protein HRS50_00700 [Mycoplasmataceae bacterium]|nr:hypothetical protein [Mycoplasmataceae bacterium]